jgi:hypothetical protein
MGEITLENQLLFLEHKALSPASILYIDFTHAVPIGSVRKVTVVLNNGEKFDIIETHTIDQLVRSFVPTPLVSRYLSSIKLVQN